MINLEVLTDKVNIITREVGSFIRGELGKVQHDQIITKDHNSLVSYVDQEAEKMLVTGLKKLIPNSGFITEEDTVDHYDQEYTWIIDPLDGTTNFLYNIPHFSTSIALKHKDELVIGVINHIMGDELYYGWKNGGAFMNGRDIKCASTEDLSASIIATGFPYAANYNQKPYFEMMSVIMKEARGMRRFGSAALDMAFVANGRFTAFYETSLNPWDVAGGIVICKEAGAQVCDYFGQDSYYNGRSIIVANDQILKQLSNYTANFFDQKDIPNT